MPWLEVFAGAGMVYLGALGLTGVVCRLALVVRGRRMLNGLPVVGYGTSAPAVILALEAALQGRGDVAVGTIIGTNIASLGLILGLMTLSWPARVEATTSRREGPMFVGSAYALLAVLIDGRVTRLEGGLLLLLAAAYALWSVASPARRAIWMDTAAIEAVALATETGGAPRFRGGRQLAIALALAVLLVALGGWSFLGGATTLASRWRLHGEALGLVAVGAGAALPSLVLNTLVASRGNPVIAVSNVLGSSIFTALVGLGAAGLLGEASSEPRGALVGVMVLIGFTLLALFFLRTARTLRRWEGALLVAGYLGFAARLLVR